MSEDGASGGDATRQGDAGASGGSSSDRVVVDARRRFGQHVRWTAEMRHTFFDHLAAHCNVTAAAAAIGLKPPQVHYRRRTNTAFADEWEGAIRAGHQLLETRLIAYALAGGNTDAVDDPHAERPLDWDAGIKLYTIHKAQREGRGRPKGAAPKVATRDETDAAILAKLKTLAARKARGLEGPKA